MRLFGRFRWEITVMLEYEFASLYAAAIMVFAALVPVLNPFGGAMFFLTLTNGVDPHVRASMANQIGLYSIIVLLVCLFAGNIILNFFGISIGVLRMAGGIVLFSAGWQALNAPPQDDGAPAGQPKRPACSPRWRSIRSRCRSPPGRVPFPWPWPWARRPTRTSAS